MRKLSVIDCRFNCLIRQASWLWHFVLWLHLGRSSFTLSLSAIASGLFLKHPEHSGTSSTAPGIVLAMVQGMLFQSRLVMERPGIFNYMFLPLSPDHFHQIWLCNWRLWWATFVVQDTHLRQTAKDEQAQINRGTNRRVHSDCIRLPGSSRGCGIVDSSSNCWFAVRLEFWNLEMLTLWRFFQRAGNPWSYWISL